jgi:Bacterial Ig-like domain
VPRDEASGAWAAEPAALAEGTWTVQAEQADAAGNVGTSAPSTFRVSIPPTFVVAPAEERLGDVLAGRYTVLAACASACKATAKLTVSGAAARRLGFTTKRSMSLGSGVKRLASAGTAAVRVRLTSRARAALSRRALARATLRVTVSGGEKVALKRTVALRRSAGLARVARRGLPMWAACSTLYPLRGRLTVSSREARRLGLKRNGTKRVEVAAGRITSGPSATRMTLKVKQSARKALRRAARMQAQFEAVAGTPPDPTRTAKRTLTLRR